MAELTGEDAFNDASAHPQSSADTPLHEFEFSARGSEYFRIWIVNVLLTVLTLGIYSAWATVRTQRYLYGHTRLAGDSFEFHAQPLTILRGRLLAIGAFIVYLLVSSFLPLISVLLVLAILVLVPWIITRALRFRAVMSSWRGMRFDFDGTQGGAAVRFWVAAAGHAHPRPAAADELAAWRCVRCRSPSPRFNQSFI